MSKKIGLVGQEARDKGIKGLEYVGKAILSTVGPYGLNFLLVKGRKITNDGYSIASELVGVSNLDEFERLCAQVANEASSKTNDMVGDATSTSWGLNYTIVKEAKRYLPNDKSFKAQKSPSEIARLINKDKDYILEKLKEMAKPIESAEELVKSALVSAEDEKLATLLGKMQWELGPGGRIIAEETNDSECSIEKVEGLVLDNGFVSSTFISNPEKGSLEINDMPIMLTNYTIGEEEMLKLKDTIFSDVKKQRKPGIVIVARAFTSDAIKHCQETAGSSFVIIPINAPYTDQKEVMRDIQAVVGGRYIDAEEASLDDIYITDIGFARKIIAQHFNSVISGVKDEHSEKRVKDRVEILKKKLEGSQSDFEKNAIEDRIAQLTNGFAILKVGSRSVNNRKRLKDKADDAVHSVRNALKGGTVKGGGLAFKEIADTMPDDSLLKRPICCVYDAIMESAPEGFVIEDWVRDPYITLKTALENACDFDCSFISLGGIIAEKDKKEKEEE